MSWLKRERSGIKTGPRADRPDVPEGLWTKCDGCGEPLFQTVLEENLWTCPHCDHHFRVPAREYLGYLVDEGSFRERHANLVAADPLEFRDAKMRYPDRLAAAQKETGEKDAAICGIATIGGVPVSCALMNFFFMGGSMGSVVGEKVARAIEDAIAGRRAVVVVSATGGARMQEGILSLMQMAKTSAALGRLAAAGLPYISVLTNPTTGGVSASYATLGDVILAEPGALIGFAGPRVIKDTTKQTLPTGFQTSEFLLKHGLIDQIVKRTDLRDRIGELLQALHVKKKSAAPAAVLQT
jgi:acetyl-CoA carboxylase carboxyl transferase subunit beta